MIFLLIEQDDCIMTYFMFYNEYGIKLCAEKKEKDCRATNKGTRNVDFADIKCRVDKKVTFTWNSLFQAFQDKEFQILLHDDMSTKLSKDIYKNIIKYGLHKATVKIPVLPCLDVIEWITWKIDHENRAILNSENESVAN